MVLDFWGDWCIPCIEAMPYLMDVAERFAGRPVKWLSIHTPNLKSFDELDRKLTKFQAESWDGRPLNFPTVLDVKRKPGDDRVGKTAGEFGVQVWPTIVLIDQTGNIVGPTDKRSLAESIEMLLSGSQAKPVRVFFSLVRSGDWTRLPSVFSQSRREAIGDRWEEAMSIVPKSVARKAGAADWRVADLVFQTISVDDLTARVIVTHKGNALTDDDGIRVVKELGEWKLDEHR